jgi:hypothetical protein
VEYTLFTFRKSVALALAAEWENMGCRSKNDGTSPSKKMRSTTLARFHLRKLNDMHVGTRFTSADGHLSFLAKIPLKPGSKLSKRQMPCAECKNKRSSFWCKECEKPLCKGMCFHNFHTNIA